MARTLNTLELCIIYKVSYPTVEKWRTHGLPFVKRGNLYYYDKDEVFNWMSVRRRTQRQPTTTNKKKDRRIFK